MYDEDKYRDFIMEFCLGNDHISITEKAGRNSGFIGGRFMASSRLRKPNTDIDDNIFYGTKDLAIGKFIYIYLCTLYPVVFNLIFYCLIENAHGCKNRVTYLLLV